MTVKLPSITAGLEIGTINLKSNNFHINSKNRISFNCKNFVECCSQLIILVTGFDIRRIESHGYELDQILESLSPFFLPAKTYGKKPEKLYQLKRKPFDNSCTFMYQKKCLIHEFKPFSCKIYPFSLKILDENRISIIIHREKLCNAITAANSPEANNNTILQNLLNLINMELEERKIISQ